MDGEIDYLQHRKKGGCCACDNMGIYQSAELLILSTKKEVCFLVLLVNLYYAGR